MSVGPVLLACSALALSACSTRPPVDLAAETASLRARGQALRAAEASRNLDAAMAFWAQDAVVQRAGTPQIQGHDALRVLFGQVFGTNRLKQQESTTSKVELSPGGDLAYEYGVDRKVFTGPNGDLLDIGKYLAVWKKIDGQWLIVALSVCSDTPAPVPLDPK